MTNEGRWELPPLWQWARTIDFATVVGGGTPKNAKSPQNYAEVGIPWITPADLSGYRSVHISRGARDLSAQGFSSCSARLMPEGTVLLSSRAPVGYCAVASNEISTNQGFKSLVFRGHGILPEFLRYYLIGSKQYLQSEASGTTFLELSGGRAEQLLFPIAPTAEQERIVSKIDELFSRIDEGERALERVQKLVERYRQSVIKAAVTGELTRDWREKHKDKVETGEAQLSSMLKARREGWEKAELQKIKARGIAPINDKWKQRYEVPANATVGFTDVPRTWAQPSLEQATRADRPIAYGVLQPGPDVADGVPLIRVCDVDDGCVDPANLKRIAAKVAAQFPRTRLYGGEVLLTLVGTVGRTGVVPQQLAGANVARAVGVLVPNEGVEAAWLEVCLRHEGVRQLLVGSSREVARKTLNLEQLREIAVPLPPLKEQQEALSRLDQELSKVAAIERTLLEQVRMSAALRHAALKSAFAGRLVAQLPEDEPASALLERIAAGRGTNNAAQKRGRKKKTPA